MADMDFDEVVIASLFHDLGKIAQRAKADEFLTPGMEGQLLPNKGGWYSHRHAWYTHGAVLALRDSFPQGIDAERVANLAALHHNPGSATDWIIAEGDRISSGADRTLRELETEKKSGYIEQACLSVFTSVRLPGKADSPEMFLELAPLSPEHGYPKPSFRNSSTAYRAIWDGLISDLKAIRTDDIPAYLDAADAALEHWTWSVPSTTIDQPDISLYDHVRTAAAFSAALYRFHEEERNLDVIKALQDPGKEKFALVSGDLSGIQKYLFDLKTAKYSAKILRARSFELRVLAESAVRMVCREFRVPIFARISNAGGRFLLVLPNYADTGARLEKLQTEIDVAFIDRFAGQVAMPLSLPVTASKQSLYQGEEHFSSLFRSITDASAEAKQHKLQHGLASIGHVLHTDYEQLESAIAAGGTVCPICDIRPSALAGEPCNRCDSLIYAGTQLPKARYLSISTRRESTHGLALLSGERLFFHNEPQPGTMPARIHEFESGFGHARMPYTVPIEQGSVKEFEQIAEASSGVKHLAMFKADLDSLGYIFSTGLGPALSISRYATLSRTLDYFFTVMVRDMIESRPEFRDIYTVYSGGDDLCVIGPWDVILEFAANFAARFRKFTCNSPSLTVSGGIALAGRGLPVRRMADEAEEQLDLAKDTPGKDSVAAFGVSVRWKQYANLLEDARALSDELVSGGAATAAIYALLQDSRRAENFAHGDISPENALWKSHFAYSLRRSKASKATMDILTKYSVDAGSMITARILASIALYKSRKGGK